MRVSPAATPLPIAHPPSPSDRALSLRLLCVLRCAVRDECVALQNASLECQRAWQSRGDSRDRARERCTSTVEEYQQCNRKKAVIDSKRGWMTLQRQQMQLQSQPAQLPGR